MSGFDSESLEEVLRQVRSGDLETPATKVNAALIRLMWESHRSLERRVNGLYALIVASVAALLALVA